MRNVIAEGFAEGYCGRFCGRFFAEGKKIEFEEKYNGGALYLSPQIPVTLGRFRTVSDGFGQFWMVSDGFGCVSDVLQTISDKEKFRKKIVTLTANLISWIMP